MRAFYKEYKNGDTVVGIKKGPLTVRSVNKKAINSANKFVSAIAVAKITPFKNKKVIGATKTLIDGIKFDSKLESYFYGRLKQFKVEFEMQKVYVLQPKFFYLGKSIQDICIKVDFYLPKHLAIIDTKGWQTADNKIKIKMLKFVLAKQNLYESSNTPTTSIYLPSSQKECDSILLKLTTK